MPSTAVATAPPHAASTTPTEIVAADGTRYPLRHYTAAGFNDPHATQWWTTAINAETLWNTPVTSSYVPTIAVLDTGFALGHEELAGRWATNPDDPVDGIDNDGDGYVDDWRGWDFADDDNDPQAGAVDPSGTGTTHGTMTAGAAAATGNNGRGIAGVSQSARILPIQVMSDDSDATSVTLAQGVVFASLRHADVISISLGSHGDDPYLRQAIDYAIARGAVVVASSGNDGCDCVSYPAAYPEVLAVGALGQTGSPTSFSNYGSALDLLAPGENLTLPAWSASLPTNGYMSGVAGTSFSAPIVAGTLAQLKALEPTATGGELIAALMETADHRTLTAAAPRSTTLGGGTLDAGAAATRVTTPQAPSISYSLGAVATDALGSTRVDDCQGAYPTAELFEIADGAQTGPKPAFSYTISPLDVASASAAGESTRSLGYQCVGQPVDRPQSLRTLNLAREIH